MLFKYSDIEPKDRYKLMSQSVTPRPIAWIVTKDKDILNVAPFSYFTPLSSNPPSLIVSIGHKADGTPKDTLRNIRKSGICSISLPTKELLEPMHFSSKALADDVSEIEYFNIKTKKVFDKYPPIIEGVDVAFGCRLLQEVNLPGSKTIPLILEIKEQFIEDRVIKDLDSLKLNCNNLGRVGANYISKCQIVSPPDIP